MIALRLAAVLAVRPVPPPAGVFALRGLPSTSYHAASPALSRPLAERPPGWALDTRVTAPATSLRGPDMADAQLKTGDVVVLANGIPSPVMRIASSDIDPATGATLHRCLWVSATTAEMHERVIPAACLTLARAKP